MRKLIIFQLNDRHSSLHIYNKDSGVVTFCSSSSIKKDRASYNLFMNVNKYRLKAEFLMVDTL